MPFGREGSPADEIARAPRRAGWSALKSLAIVLAATLAAIGYGILHDQIVVRICVEACGSGRPPSIDPSDPELVALVRGVLATWWVGAVAGFVLAFAARAGSRPKLGALELALPMLSTLLASAVSGVAGGLLGAWLAARGAIEVAEELARLVPQNEHVDYLTDLWARGGSLVGGALASLAVCVRTWRRRGRKRTRAARRTPRRSRYSSAA